MVRSFPFVAVALLALVPDLAVGQGRTHDGLVSKHATAHGVPESLVRRVIHIESKGNPRVVSKGNYGLMQIRLGTARAMGYRGGADGLLDADTNMTYAVKYLAGAYRAARGNHEQAIRNYQRGYYHQAKAQGFSPYTMASNVQQPVTQQAAAPDPTMMQQEMARQQQQQAAEQARIAQQQAAQQARIEQQQARAAQRQAMLQQKVEQQQQQQQARIAQRQAMLQQQAEQQQARRQQAIEREQMRQQQRIEQQQQRTQSARPVSQRRVEASPNYVWYNPMRYFKHPAHQANPYKPAER